LIKALTSSLQQNKEEKEKYRWATAATLIVLFIIGSVMNIPFSREVTRLNIEAGKADSVMSLDLLSHLTQVGISSLILGTILVFIGISISSNTNLGAPVLARLFSGKPISELVKVRDVLSSIALASLVPVFLLGLFELQKSFYPVDHLMNRPDKPFYILVSFSAGITEEIMFRLGLMSLLVAVFQFFKKNTSPSPKSIWIAIIISSIFFGLIHLPLSKNFVELKAFSIAVTMIGNLITGITFGYIFWRKGLLIAILSHIVFDLVFHVVGSPYA
jgi:membrane protease YdiL (CAAX protease family)